MKRYNWCEGKTFGRLTVKETFKNEKGAVKCRCICSCGREKEVFLSNLSGGRTKSCGCKEEENRKKFRDITGMRFGKVTAVEPTDKRKFGCVVWRCTCACGTKFEKDVRSLVRGYTTHCGCDRKRMGGSRVRDISNQRFRRLVALYPTKKRTGSGSVIWKCRCDCGNFAEVSENDLVHGNRISCGCRVAEVGRELVNYLHFVDGTCVEFLQRKPRKDNTSGCTGIYRLKNGRYKAGITFKKVRYHLGYFDTFAEAKAVRMEAEERMHKAFLAKVAAGGA